MTYFKLIMVAMATTTEESVHNMQELLNPDSLKKIKGDILRLLVSQLSGPIALLVNLTLRRALSNLAGLSLDTICSGFSSMACLVDPVVSFYLK